MYICFNSFSSPVYAFTLDSFQYYLFAYDDIHDSCAMALCGSRISVGWSTFLSDIAICFSWTLTSIEAPLLMWSFKEQMKLLCLMAPKVKVILPCVPSDVVMNFVVLLSLDDCHRKFFCDIFTMLFILKTKDSWLYFKCVPPCHDLIYCTNPNPHALRMLCLFVLSLILKGIYSRSKPYQ